MRLAKKIALGILLTLLILLGALTWLIGTASGLHLLVNGAARWVPGLAVESVAGGWRDLTLKGIHYRMPGVTVAVGQFSLALDPTCLRHSQLCLNSIALQDVDVEVNTAELAPAPAAPAAEDTSGALHTPYPLILRQLRLDNVRVQIDHTMIALATFSTGMDFHGNNLTIMPTEIDNLRVALPKTAEVIVDRALGDVSQTAAQKQAVAHVERPTATTPPQPPLADTLRALFAKPLLSDLPEVRLPVNIRVMALRGQNLRLTGDTDIIIDQFFMQGQSVDGEVKLEKLQINAAQGALYASGEAQLKQQWPLHLTVNAALNVAPMKGEKIKLTLRGALRDRLVSTLNLSGPVKAQLTASTQLAVAGLPLDLALTSPGLQWPIQGDAQYRVSDLALKLGGQAVDYQLQFRADLSAKGLPPAGITLTGKGNPAQFTLSRLRVSTLEGYGDLSAVVDWSDVVSWRSELTLTGIDTSRQWPDWPARLAGKIVTQGSLHGGSWQLRIPEFTLDGNIKQNQLTARGSLSGNAAGQWHIPGLRLVLGRNSLNVTGNIDHQLALDAVLDAPNLNGALPGLAGNAHGTLTLRGERRAPRLAMDLSAAGLRWQTLSVAKIALNGNVSASDIVRGNVDMRINGLKQGDMLVRQLTLAASGDERRHQLRLNVQGDPVSGGLVLNGGYDRQQQRWRATLSQTAFTTPMGPWRLSRDMALDYQQGIQRITIGPHCWINPHAELCVPTAINAGASGQATLLLNRLDLVMLKPYLPPQTELDGLFSGRADISWQPGGGLPQARISLVGKGVKMTQGVQGGSLPIAFDTLNLNLGVERDRARFDWQIGIAGNGQFNGQIQVADPLGRRSLSGTIAVRQLSLAIVNPILSNGESVGGMLNANLRIGGDVAQPQLFGQLGLDQVLIRGNWMPFAMTESRLGMTFSGTSSTLAGTVHTTQGQINLTGSADWSRINDWRARIAAQGTRVRITVPPMVRLDISPNIILEASPQQFTLNGKVDIPWARIVVKELPASAVGVSQDEVILDDRLQPVARRQVSTAINSNLIIHVGNDVRLDAFGLKARLDGDLKMVQDKQGLGLNGQINIPYGRFSAYGQDLIVRRGQLLFAGPPDRPVLNIEAIRNPDSTADGVIAGIRVTGMADQPKLEVFSDPVKSQQEALSYLLRGQGLNAPGADSSAMTSMLIGIGVAQSGQLVGKIGAAFGVSDLTLDTQGVGDDSQVVVSGYLTPGLQVKYGVGIFDSLATITLRYRLMPRLYLEAVSGLNQALDLLYQFEF
ncbi:translocation/assembly module TamB domain-containing protein [Acerihabitans sp. TG2]|uniref:autotransporter assembly complex protein TamB n=1 Tax=Acerihabitans sp. TG2 TaxID=3096008 RepID=UPI002B235244|nr:translocation/assembly module TamB domain-containing protein [Acerihabitans sp. TG2]MEA9393077.1 translocation/assembly module TamB domain-containing protein [Acerihabitans sp. TG2]